MVSVTMSAKPPLAGDIGGVIHFQLGPGFPPLRDQIHDYYEEHFRQGHMETFAQFVLEKGHGAMAPPRYKDGQMIRETWQACGRRLFGERFVPVMERAINEYRASHAAPPPEPLPEPPAHFLENIPDPDF
jgi:hypothetical protein